MRHIVTFTLTALAIAGLFATPAAAYEIVQAPLSDDPMATTIYKLDNGLTVYLTENHETPRFYAEIAVRAGSKHDPAESTGLAHYLEHLLFKGTKKLGTLDYAKEKEHLDEITELYQLHFHETDIEKRKALYAKINEASLKAAEYAVPNEMDRLYSAMGATNVNAHTWHEETVYKVSLPANRLKHWCILESERFSDPVYRLFVTELETVYEEMNRALDNKDRIIRYAVEEQLYKVHPYGQQHTLGKVEHLKNPSLQNIDEYFETWYVPNNMAIAISGAIDKTATIDMIEQYFSDWEPKPLPEPVEYDERSIEGREYVERTYEGEEYVLMGFRTVARDHADAEALQLLDMVLDNATAGLINLNLNQKQKVRSAGSYPSQYNDYGAQYLFGVPKDGQTLEEVEQLLLEQLEIVKRGEIEQWLIDAIVNDFKKTEKRGLESDLARVSSMRDSFLAFEPWEERVRRLDRMSELTKDDVIRVANTYFGDDYVVGYRKDAPHEVPDIEKPELATISIDPSRQSEFAQMIANLEFDPIEPDFVDESDFSKVEDERGIAYYHVANPVNDLFTLTFTIDFGTHEDNTINIAAQLLNKSGTENYSAAELQQEWYKLGTDFGLGAGDNETTISLSGLDENFEASVALLMELLNAPEVEDGVLAELKKIILVEREDAKKQAASIARALYQYNRYGDESVYLRMLPSDKLEALNEDRLHARVGSLLDYKHTVGYVGSLPLEKVRAVLAKYRDTEKQLKDPPPYRFLKARSPERSEIYFHDKDTAQATIRLEFGTHEYDPAMEPVIQFYNEYFSGGMSGIVFQELREARALAYFAGARYVTGYRTDDQDLMLGLIQSQNDKTPEALAAFVELMDELPESPERFETARQSLVSRYRTGKIGFRGVIDAVRSWERKGLAVDPREERFETIQTLPFEALMAFHEKVIADEPKLISIVGDESKIDLEVVKKFGPLTKVPLDAIFVD